MSIFWSRARISEIGECWRGKSRRLGWPVLVLCGGTLWIHQGALWIHHDNRLGGSYLQ